MKRFLTHWLPVILWAALIFYFSSRPAIQASSRDTLDFIIKKTAHLTEYTIFFLLLSRALTSPRRFHYALLIAIFYAFLDETHQLFTPGRTGTIRDAIAFDTTSIVISYLILSSKFSSKNA